MNSIFYPSILGWREFIRGIYLVELLSCKQANEAGITGGIVPLDDSIKTKMVDHIPRLMVISNLMNLCEINPKEIYKDV